MSIEKYPYNKKKDLNKNAHTLDESNDLNHIPENDNFEHTEKLDNYYKNKNLLNENEKSSEE